MTHHTLYSKKYIMGVSINMNGVLLLYEQRGMLSRWMRTTYRKIDNSKWHAHKSPKQCVKQLTVWNGSEFKQVK